MADAKWYVVHTYSGYENKVAQNIEKVVENQGFGDLIFEVRIPTEKVVEYKDDKKREVERKIFPGYVLVKMIQTDDSWYVVRNIRGVTGFVGSTTEPIPLTDEEVVALGVEVRRVQSHINVGDSVRISSGSMAGWVGEVCELDAENDKVKVAVSMFNRNTIVEMQLSQVESAEE